MGFDDELFAAAGSVGGGFSGGSVKSLVIDITDNYTDVQILGLRSVQLTIGGVPIATLSADFVAGATTDQGASFIAANAFDTSLSKTGAGFSFVEWGSETGNTTNQRLICVYDSPISFDGITINNSHNSGGDTDRGAKNVKIYFTEASYMDLVFEAAIPGGVLIFNGQFAEHVSLDQADDQILTLT